MGGKKNAASEPLPKTSTGIPGFDQLSRGGLPRNRTTLVKGGPGSGKTVFALQTLVNVIRRRREPGIFVAFEESARESSANAAAIRCFFMGCLPMLRIVRQGAGARECGRGRCGNGRRRNANQIVRFHPV